MSKIAMITPWPKQRTGIADYAYDLVVGLSEAGVAVDVYTDCPHNQRAATPADAKNITLFDIDQFRIERGYDNLIYQMGNNSTFHLRMLSLLFKYPGVVHLHDPSLHHLMAYILYRPDSLAEYYQVLNHWYGYRQYQRVKQFMQLGREAFWDSEYVGEVPFFEPVLQNATACIVHSQYARDRVLKLFPGIGCHVLPQVYRNMHPVPLVTDANQPVSPSPLQIGVFGIVQKHKHVQQVFASLRDIKKRLPAHSRCTPFHLHVCGELDEGCKHYPVLAKEYGIETDVTFYGHLTESEFLDRLRGIDLCVSLRYPTLGETSAIVSRNLQLGIPTIVSEVGWYAELPECVRKIDMDAGFADRLTRHLETMILDRSQFTTWRHSCYASARDMFSFQSVTEQYADTIAQSFPAVIGRIGMTGETGSAELATGKVLAHSPSRRGKLLIDCTSTRTCRFNSGIQRVVRSLCRQAHANTSDHWECTAVYGQAGQWFQTHSLWPDYLPEAENGSGKQRSLMQRVVRELNRGYRKLQRKLGKAESSYETAGESTPPNAEACPIAEGDVLLMADASWMAPNWEALEQARHKKARIGLLIYDLIPLRNPELFSADLAVRFQQWFDRASLLADFVVCISKSVAADVRAELNRRGNRLAQSVYDFPLGADIEPEDHCGEASPQLQNWFAGKRGQNPCLVVGTLEPRKNHHLILDAFESRWKAGAELSLCILGRIGWNCEALLQRIRSHDEFGKRLWLKTDASDRDVQFAYDKARCVIMASKNEGYGLPIIEGLRHRQWVLASDIGVHREVGKEWVSYFDIQNGAQSLSLQLANVEHSRDMPKAIPSDEELTGTTWLHSFEVLCQKIAEATAANRSQAA